MRMIAVVMVVLFSGSALAMPLEDYPVTGRGIGPLKIGMTLEQAEKALHKKFTIDEGIKVAECTTAGLENSQLHILLENHKITGFGIFGDSNYKTAVGAKIGDSEKKLRRLYSKARIEASPYGDNEGGYDFYIDGNLLLSTNQKRVLDFIGTDNYPSDGGCQ